MVDERLLRPGEDDPEWRAMVRRLERERMAPPPPPPVVTRAAVADDPEVCRERRQALHDEVTEAEHRRGNPAARRLRRMV